ncbi:hypothetical protein V1512DRAFT_285780 [Lipomyces arxii]|uniref:uncharacterized protein n=1 Tax=Lipomyces arxii TaxID=56418 RepID=UPI0034CE0BEA
MTMETDVPLSHGVLKDIATLDAAICRDRHPNFVAQVLQVKEITSVGGPRRFRFVLSDGEFFVQCMIAAKMNDFAISKAVDRGNMIKVTDYSPSYMKEKLVVIILDFEVLTQYGQREKIGSPVSIDPKVNSQAPRPNSAVSTSSFYSNQPAPPPQRQGYSAPAAVSAPGVSVPENLYTIEALSPYQNKWTIKARVTFKSEIKHWHNQRGEGRLFSVHLLDETGEIKATGFNEQCDAYFDLLQPGQVYYISKCRVNTAKKQFSNLQNEYELMMERDTEVEKCPDGATDVPQVRFSFIDSLAKLQDVNKDSIIDAIGVVKSVGECTQITSKGTGKPYDKRDLVMVDPSGVSVGVTVWGTAAVNFTGHTDDVIAVKGAKVSDFNGKSLSLLQSSTMNLNPDIPESHKLKGWFDSAGKTASFSSLQTGANVGRDANLKTIQQVRDEQLGTQDQPDYFSVKGTILFFRHENFAYPACPTEGCNKKLIDDGDSWRCEKCEKTFPEPVYRYVLMFGIYDHTGQMWLSSFDDVGKIVLGRPAGDYMKLRDEESAGVVDEFAKHTGLAYTFRVRARQDTYQQTTRPRFSALSAVPLDYAAESKALASMISSFVI